MRIQLAGRYVTFSAETDGERSEMELIAGEVSGQQLRVDSVSAEMLSVRITGPAKAGGKGKVRSEDNVSDAGPLNITFDAVGMPLQLISNLAHTPFVLDEQPYASIEGFWQGLKFESEADRQRLAVLFGHDAKVAGPNSKPGDRIVYRGREIVTGTIEHWELMEAANRAKFTQHDGARTALLSTSPRQLVHRVPVDSRTIPGIVMGDIWMRIRAELAAG